MDAGMAPDGSGTSRLPDPALGRPFNGDSSRAASSRRLRHPSRGQGGQGDPERAVQARPQGHAPLRQNARKLQQVQQVRSQVPLAPRPRPLDSRPRSSFLSLLCAAVFQQHGLAPPGAPTFSPEQGQAQTLDTYYQEVLGDFIGGSLDYQEAGHGCRGGSLDAPAGRARGQPGEHGPGQRVRLGSRRRVTGTMDKAVASYEIERNIYDAMDHAGQRPPPAVDLLELFAGTAKPTKFAAELQLRALQPLDRDTGTDLSDPKTQQEVYRAVKKTKPWLIVAGYPSALYSLANENFNYRGQPEQLRQLRDDDRRMRRFVADLLQEQHRQGRFFLFQNPQTSHLWQQPEILEIMELPGVSSAVCHLGAFGAETKEGLPVCKPLRFLSNLPEMITDPAQKLSDTDLLFCEPVRGQAAADSHEYPDALGYNIAACLRRKL